MSAPLPTCTAWLIVKEESERVPGKNWRDFAAQPLLCWILQCLRAVPEVARIVINTDAPGRVQALLDRSPHAGDGPSGVTIRSRPPDLRDGRVDANTLLRRDLEDGVLDGLLLLTHATNPLLRPPTVRAALAAFADRVDGAAFTSLMGVTRRQARFFAEGAPLLHDPSALRPTQDLPAVDEENSCLYLVRSETVRRDGTRLGARPLPFPIAPAEAVDIDGPEDWQHASLLARGRQGALPSAALFDLDGTLIDSLPDVTAAVSVALAPHGLGPFTVPQVRGWLGLGAGHLLEGMVQTHAQEPDAVPMAEVHADFLAAYVASPAALTRPFPGVEALLAGLEAAGVPLAICTNKPRVTAEPVLDALGWADRFPVVLCPEDVLRKPAPDMLLTALARLKAARSGAVYLGDSGADAEAARRAGVACGWAEWGYGGPAPAGVARFGDVPAFGAALGELAAWGRLL